jgi:hypothetical protein
MYLLKMNNLVFSLILFFNFSPCRPVQKIYLGLWRVIVSQVLHKTSYVIILLPNLMKANLSTCYGIIL